MGYRDDLDAAQARVDALARETEELRAKNTELEAEARALEQLRARNAELQARVRELEPLTLPVLVDSPALARHRRQHAIRMAGLAIATTSILIGAVVPVPIMIGVGFVIAWLTWSLRTTAPP